MSQESGPVTAFTGQELCLRCSGWRADDSGIYDGGGRLACGHPLLPVRRLRDLDTGQLRLELAFRRDGIWRRMVVERRVLADTRSILALADIGVGVTSENARLLVRYLHDLEEQNYGDLPEEKSASRLGYLAGEGFLPYVDGFRYDGDAQLRVLYQSIRSKGVRKEWLAGAREIRKGEAPARILLAASFASALVAPCGALPFFVHLWSGESGTGKTVALMLAASVWGDPQPGRYLQSFNGTEVGQERLAAFLNHLPLLIDELQLATETGGRPRYDVYSLAEGIGRTRGSKAGGLEVTPTWANCILTTGETPMNRPGARSGALNRVLELECRPGKLVVEDGPGLAALVRGNYGFAGREFVNRLYRGRNRQRAAAIYREAFRILSGGDHTQKRAMAAALIYTADQLATEWIFRDGQALSSIQVEVYLLAGERVSAGERGYDYLRQWVAQNQNHLRPDAQEIWGVIEGEGEESVVYLLRAVFQRAMEEGGYSAAALLSYLKSRDKLLVRGRNLTRGKRLGGVLAECVAVRLEE